MARWKKVESTAATAFVERMRELGHNYPRIADNLERDGTLRLLGYTLWRKFGEEYRQHMRHYGCTVDVGGRVIGECSTRDPRLFLEDDQPKKLNPDGTGH